MKSKVWFNVLAMVVAASTLLAACDTGANNANPTATPATGGTQPTAAATTATPNPARLRANILRLPPEKSCASILRNLHANSSSN